MNLGPLRGQTQSRPDGRTGMLFPARPLSILSRPQRSGKASGTAICWLRRMLDIGCRSSSRHVDSSRRTPAGDSHGEAHSFAVLGESRDAVLHAV